VDRNQAILERAENQLSPTATLAAADMKSRTVVVGVIVLVVGIALLIGGAIGALGSITINTTFTEPHPGEYLSTEIVLNTTSGLVVTAPAAVGGIIPVSAMNSVNSSNIGTYAIPYNSTTAGSDVYRSISGDYYYVAFASTQPGTRIVATALHSGAVRFGVLVLLGLACLVAGVVVAVVGVIQKGNKKSGTVAESEYYATRSRAAQSVI
jgi:hypothetical protein